MGPARGFETAQEVARLGSGETEVVIHADPTVAGEMRAVAMPLALGLSVVLELRSILLERQAALDDAVFQLRALRQVARLLSSVHSIEDTEQLILDFMAEVFFAWWACLYRPEGESYTPKVFRSLNDRLRPAPIDKAALDRALPPGSAATGADDAAVAALVGPGAELVVPLDAGAERMAVLVLGSRISDKLYGRAELELAGHALVRGRHRAQELRAGRAAPQRRHHRRADRTLQPACARGAAGRGDLAQPSAPAPHQRAADRPRPVQGRSTTPWVTRRATGC